MLVVSRKITYTLAALMELVRFYGNGLLQAKVIAGRKSVPPNYLEQILNQLARAGIVRAVRGSKGGYELALPPEEITILKIWNIMEGGEGVNEGQKENGDAIQDLYREAEQEIQRVFSISLAELLSRQQACEEQMMEHPMFHI